MCVRNAVILATHHSFQLGRYLTIYGTHQVEMEMILASSLFGVLRINFDFYFVFRHNTEVINTVAIVGGNYIEY